MGNIRMIFFDIDGTLVDLETKRISENTLDMLRRLRQRGIRTCIATGRPPMCLPTWPNVEFDAYLTFNGSLCTAGDTVVFSNPIPQEDVQRVIRNAKALGRPISVATADRLVSDGTDAFLDEYYAIVHRIPEISEDFDRISREEVYQLILSCRPEHYGPLLQDVKGAKMAAWWDKAGDVIPANGGKGVGVEKLLAYYGIPKEEAMAFGDGNNDLEMLQAVGTGVAMANGSDRIKALATDICGPCNRDGVFHYLLDRGII